MRAMTRLALKSLVVLAGASLASDRAGSCGRGASASPSSSAWSVPPSHAAMTKINSGRAFYTSPSQLGSFLMVDYISHKKLRRR